jgi:D-sedoheptulose 7-phosphate isomerase
MTMLEQRIQQQFFEGADLKYQSAEPLGRIVAAASQSLLHAITAGGKVLVCGSGFGAPLAQHFAAVLMGRFERERPPLAALALAADGTLGAAVQALGAPGDVLVVLDAGGPHEAVLAASDAAAAGELTRIVLTDASGARWRGRLTDTDVLIAVPHDRPARLMELQLLALHSLCDALDLQLLGEQDT